MVAFQVFVLRMNFSVMGELANKSQSRGFRHNFNKFQLLIFKFLNGQQMQLKFEKPY